MGALDPPQLLRRGGLVTIIVAVGVLYFPYLIPFVDMTGIHLVRDVVRAVQFGASLAYKLIHEHVGARMDQG